MNKILSNILSTAVFCLSSTVYASSSVSTDDSIISKFSTPNFKFSTFERNPYTSGLEGDSDRPISGIKDNGKFVTNNEDFQVNTNNVLHYSADRKIGCGVIFSSGTRAFVKIQGKKLEYLAYPTDLDAKLHSGIIGMSADGSKISGTIINPNDIEYRKGFVWTREKGMVILSNFTGTYNSYANAISSNGEIVGGWSKSPSINGRKTACVWNDLNQHYILKDVLNLQEIVIPDHIHLETVEHFSPNLKAMMGVAVDLSQPDCKLNWSVVFPSN